MRRLLTTLFSTVYFKNEDDQNSPVLEAPHALLFDYNSESREYSPKPVLFKDFDIPGSESYFSPKLAFSTLFRRNSKVQNEMKMVQKLLEVRLFLYTLGVQDFSKCKLDIH